MFFFNSYNKITEEIDYHKYKIKNIVESYDYRTLNIEPECLQTINKICSKDKCDFSDLLSVMFLNSNLNLTKVNYTRERYSDLKGCYKKKSANEYNNVSKNIAAILTTLFIFLLQKAQPVASGFLMKILLALREITMEVILTKVVILWLKIM